MSTAKEAGKIKAACDRLIRALRASKKQKDRFNEAMDQATKLRDELLILRTELKEMEEKFPENPGMVVEAQKKIKAGLKMISQSCDNLLKRWQETQKLAEQRDEATDEAEKALDKQRSKAGPE